MIVVGLTAYVCQFQFHKVQLKGDEEAKKALEFSFQFHKVQLKGT